MKQEFEIYPIDYFIESSPNYKRMIKCTFEQFGYEDKLNEKGVKHG